MFDILSNSGVNMYIVRKYVSAVLGIVLVAMLAVGCTGSGAEEINQNNVETTPTPEITPTEIATPIQTPTKTTYQDAEWLLYVSNWCTVLGNDGSRISSAAKNLDFKELADVEISFVTHTQNALDENCKYRVSPKYQEAQNEWVLALTDYNTAGKGTYLGADAAIRGDYESFTAYVNQATPLMTSGTQHMNNVGVLIQNVNK